MRKILIVADLPLQPSGVGNLTKELAKALVNANYEVICLAMLMDPNFPNTAIYHSFDSGEKIKIISSPRETQQTPYLLNMRIFKEVMQTEKPDCLVLFQDPFKFGPLWDLLPSIKVPVYFVSIWDSYLTSHKTGQPHYLLPLYENVNSFGCYSRQHEWFVNEVFTKLKHGRKPTINYIPIGSNPNTFKPLTTVDCLNTRNEIIKDPNINFVVGVVNNNQHRKKICDIMLGFQGLVESLPPEQGNRCALIIHAPPISNEGWNLVEVGNALTPNCKIIITEKVAEDKLNQIINCFDVFVTASNAEGYGLNSNSALLAGIPCVINTVGGLIDQCGFVDENNQPLPWNLNYKKNLPNLTCGEWCYPLYPNPTVIGNIITHYLFDENAVISDITKGLQYFYNLSPEERKAKGLKGRDWIINQGQTAANFTSLTVKAIDDCIVNYKPEPSVKLYKV